MKLRLNCFLVFGYLLFSCIFADNPDYTNSVVLSNSQNEECRSKSIPFFDNGVEGVTIVFKNNKELYTVKEYNRKSLVSNDGQYLILYSSRIETSASAIETYRHNLLSFYKNGQLIRRILVKDIFPVIGDADITSSHLYWLKNDESFYPNESYKKKNAITLDALGLNIITLDGYEWSFDLDTGKTKSKKSVGSKWRPLELPINEKNTAKSKKESLKKYFLEFDKFKFYDLRCFEIKEDGSRDQYNSIMQIDYEGSIAILKVSTININSFKSEFPLLIRSVKTYIKNFKSVNKNKTIRIYCHYDNTYVDDDRPAKGFTALEPRESCDIPESVELLNNTFVVRDCDEFDYLGMPYIIKYSEKNDKIDFSLLSKYE